MTDSTPHSNRRRSTGYRGLRGTVQPLASPIQDVSCEETAGYEACGKTGWTATNPGNDHPVNPVPSSPKGFAVLSDTRSQIKGQKSLEPAAASCL